MIDFPAPGAAQGKYAQVFLNWGNPVPIGKVQAMVAINEVRAWAQCSRTAQQILKTVDGAGKIIHVVCFNGTGETVFSSDDPAPGEGTIFWNIKARFATKQGNGQAALHHYIAFLHEAGHAVQWLENPVFFEGNMLHGGAGQRTIQDAAQAFWMRRAVHENASANFGAQKAYAQLRMMTGNNRLTRPAWAVRIEMDNLIRHEWPICDESGHARRLGYTDLIML